MFCLVSDNGSASSAISAASVFAVMDYTVPHFTSRRQPPFRHPSGTLPVLPCHSLSGTSELPENAIPINQVERRYLSIMFCDLVNSTGLVTRLDPEDLLQLIQAYRNTCADTINYYGGFTACYMGDGIMSYFGYPRAHEDDAERAVYAALDLLASFKARKTGLTDVDGNRISVRIGIASGLVVVGNLTGTGNVPEETIIGQAPNLAARLQSLAQPDTAIVSTETRNLVHDRFRLKNIGMHSLAGFKKTQMLWQVVDETDSKTPFHSGKQINQPVLLGRTREFRRIIRQWNLARHRHGRVVLVCGETGIGKSKLLDSIYAYVSRENCNRFIYRCSPAHKNDDLYSELAQLQATVRLFPGYSVAGHGLTEKPAAARPCLVILEDTHRITSGSLDQLTELIPLIRGRPVLLAISCRSQFKPPDPWFEQDHVEKITLSPFNRAAAESFIRQIIGKRRIPAHLITRIIDGADGIPFFLEELTRTALQNMHTQDRGLPRFPQKIEVPEKVRTVLMTRLDQDSYSREAAQVGAALGREFSYGILAMIWAHGGNKLNDALGSLCRAGVLIKTGNGDNARYTFKWILLREVAYQSMLKRVRQKLHRRIIGILLEYFPEYARLHPELLNYHASLAGGPKNL